jgi:geranylgeranyl diphosphate synthase, type I
MHFFGINATIGEVETKRVAVASRAPASRTVGYGSAEFGDWLAHVRDSICDHVDLFVRDRCAADLPARMFDVPARVLSDFASGGKCVRSTFVYLGWLCGADESDAALRAAASAELLHAFALLQDDVMDQSPVRRGRPAAHVSLARWHADQGLSGSADRFGESAAILLADLYLVWAEQMMRESGVGSAALARAWPRYDAMRSELAIGQLADLANDASRIPPLTAVLDIARRKSGNYTVRRPLELGAAMAGCDDAVLRVLGEYGAVIGEAFQIRDDILGIFGEPAVTGKPAGEDIREHKATTVVALAQQLADPAQKAWLRELWQNSVIDADSVELVQELITITGARRRAEQMITDRVEHARRLLAEGDLEPNVSAALHRMALLCTNRKH